jgi:hypothetical protein
MSVNTRASPFPTAAPPRKHDPARATAGQADIRTRRHGGLRLSTKVVRRPPPTRGGPIPPGFVAKATAASRPYPVAFSTRTTPHPALIPHDVAGSSRPRPPTPATPESEKPGHSGNPRQSPLSPQAPRPACHAGGRGFEPVAPVSRLPCIRGTYQRASDLESGPGRRLWNGFWNGAADRCCARRATRAALSQWSFARGGDVRRVST